MYVFACVCVSLCVLYGKCICVFVSQSVMMSLPERRPRDLLPPSLSLHPCHTPLALPSPQNSLHMLYIKFALLFIAFLSH